MQECDELDKLQSCDNVHEFQNVFGLKLQRATPGKVATRHGHSNLTPAETHGHYNCSADCWAVITADSRRESAKQRRY